MKKILPWALCFLVLFFYPPAYLPFTDGKWLALWVSGVFSLLYLLRAPVIFPNFSYRRNAIFSVLIAAMVGQLFWSRADAFLFVFCDRLAFLLLALGFWKAFRQGLSGKDFWTPLGLGLFFAALGALIQWPAPGGFFADGVQAAEAVALLFLAFTALSPPERARPLITRGFLFLALTLGAFFLLLRGSGWLLLTLATALAYLSFRGGEEFTIRRHRLINSLRLAALAMGFFLALAVTLGTRRLPTFLAAWPLSAGQLSLWWQTFLLAAQNLFGVGPGRFEFASLTPMAASLGLAENQRLMSPANEFLRWAVEDGFALSIAYVAAWAFVVARYRQKSSFSGAWALALALFLGAGSIALPLFQNALVVALAAGLLGLMASDTCGEFRIRGGLKVMLLRLNLGVAVILLIGAAMVSRTLEAQGPRAGIACLITPANWRACLNAGHERQAAGDFQTARFFVESVLAHEPDNLLAQQQLVFIAGNQRRNLEACFLLWRFDDFYGGKSSQHERLVKNCKPKWLEYFAKKRPARFYERQSKMPSGF